MQIDDFGAVLKRHAVHSGSGVPCSFFKPLVNYMGADPGLDYLPAASEGEAVAVAAGLTTAGRPAFALMQNSGLGNAVNPITSMLYIYGMPVVLLVSHRGQPGLSDEPQHARMGEITEELVRLCGIECHVLDPERFDETLGSALERGVPAAWVVRQGTLSGGPEAPPIQLSIETSAADLPARGRYAAEISREEALRAILPLLNGDPKPAVVATTGKLSRELYELDDRDHEQANRFYMVGSMGCAGGFGLGIARARRGKVIVLDGDGALLMKMGTLATVGLVQPSNYHHVVIDNAAHDSTGGQITASPNVDTAAVALACGYRRADTACTAADFAQLLGEHLAQEGPTLLRMLVKPGARGDLGRPKLAPRAAYARFCGWLGQEGS